MRREDESHIVADGQARILDGYAARLRARFLRRAAPLLERGNPLQRMAIRYRMSRFVRAQIQRHRRKLAPFEALYALPSQKPLVSRSPVRLRQTFTQAMQLTAGSLAINFLR
jgi:hypothetical protein